MSTLDSLEVDAESDGAPDMSDSSSVTSVFESVRSPVPSLARKRNLRMNPPSGLRKGKGVAKGNPKGISPSDRLREYRDEKLVVSNHKLFCSACREELSTKKSSIASHIQSKKHATAKQKLLNEMPDVLRAYDSCVHPVGEGLPEATRIYRINSYAESRLAYI